MVGEETNKKKEKAVDDLKLDAICSSVIFIFKTLKDEGFIRSDKIKDLDKLTNKFETKEFK